MRVEQIAGTGGIVVTEFDARNATDAEIDQIRKAVVDHIVAVLPDQALDPEAQITFTRRFGPPGDVPFIEPLADHPEVIAVVKEAADGQAPNFGGIWHSDFSFQARPPSFTFLQAVEVPDHGGDTVWTNMRLAYAALSEDDRARVADLRAVHSASRSYGPANASVFEKIGGMNVSASATDDDTAVHPLVTQHPESGETCLYYNHGYVAGVEGLDKSAEARLLRHLHHHCTDVRFTVRHRWRRGDLAIWDNRSSQHIALNDYSGEARRMHRTTCAGGVPQAPVAGP